MSLENVTSGQQNSALTTSTLAKSVHFAVWTSCRIQNRRTCATRQSWNPGTEKTSGLTGRLLPNRRNLWVKI